MGWIDKASKTVFLALCAVFALDPEGEEANRIFRRAYLNPTTSPESPRQDNVCYYTLSPEASPTGSTVLSVYYGLDDQGRMTATTRKILPLSCQMTFYGADAEEMAEACWSGLYCDYGAGSPQRVFRDNRMILIPSPDHPVSLPELQGGLWRRRCDLRVSMQMDISHTLTQPKERTSPAVDVSTVPVLNIERNEIESC